jgi:hypothetical protein
MSDAPMLTTEQPMAFAELIARFKFSVSAKVVIFSFEFTTRTSMVSGTASLMRQLEKNVTIDKTERVVPQDDSISTFDKNIVVVRVEWKSAFAEWVLSELCVDVLGKRHFFLFRERVRTSRCCDNLLHTFACLLDGLSKSGILSLD